MQYTVTEIAEVCHEANRALQRIQAAHLDTGVPIAAPWADFAEQDGVINGVETALNGASPDELHEAWCEQKRGQGWTYGPIKDAEAKTHPCLVDYDALPVEQQDKDDLFAAIVDALGEVESPPLDLAGRHPSTVHAMRMLGVNPKLAPQLASVSRACCSLASFMAAHLPDGPELTAGLRKLLEAKDCFVRAALDR